MIRAGPLVYKSVQAFSNRYINEIRTGAFRVSPRTTPLGNHCQSPAPSMSHLPIPSKALAEAAQGQQLPDGEPDFPGLLA